MPTSMLADSFWGAQLLPAPVFRSSILPSLRQLQSQKVAPVCKRRLQQTCSAGMGIGFKTGDEGGALLQPSRPEIVKDYGLSIQQMHALGLTSQSFNHIGEPRPELLTAKACYGGRPVSEYHRTEPTMMAAGTGAAPGQAPPDLPSLLLDARICYIGMPLVPQVTELVISELLWLNYSSPERPVYLYIQSTGSQTHPWNEPVAFETEAHAIIDTLAYIRPDVHTLVIGQALGNAALLLASGKKGCRFALPNARVMTAPPRMGRAVGPTVNMMIKANELEVMTQTYVDFLHKFTGRDKDELRKDIGRNRYFNAKQAIEYGLIDRVVQPRGSGATMEKRNYESMLAQAQATQGRRGAPAGAPAEGY